MLDIGAQARDHVGGIGGEIDVGKNAPGLAEDQDATAQLYRLLKLVRDDDGGVARSAREIDKGSQVAAMLMGTPSSIIFCNTWGPPGITYASPLAIEA